MYIYIHIYKIKIKLDLYLNIFKTSHADSQMTRIIEFNRNARQERERGNSIRNYRQ